MFDSGENGRIISCSLKAYLKAFYSQEHAYESSQKYKEGKYIIEVAHMIKDNRWN